MNRRNFFKRLAIGVAAVAISPKIVAEVTKPASVWGPGLEKRMFNQVIILKNRRCGMTYMYSQYPEFVRRPISQEDFMKMVEYLRPHYEKANVYIER